MYAPVFAGQKAVDVINAGTGIMKGLMETRDFSNP